MNTCPCAWNSKNKVYEWSGLGNYILQVFKNATLIDAFAAVLKDKFAAYQFLQVSISVLSSREPILILSLKKIILIDNTTNERIGKM